MRSCSTRRVRACRSSATNTRFRSRGLAVSWAQLTVGDARHVPSATVPVTIRRTDHELNLSTRTPHGREAPKAALLIAHPGHELRVHGWLELTRPLTFVLTKGDGAAGHSRLASTTKVLTAAGACSGAIYGRFDDRRIYTALLDRDETLFLGLLDELVTSLVEFDVNYLAVDAEEGFNPSHDVCRYLAEAGVRMASRLSGRVVSGFDFPLVGPPDDCPEELRDDAMRLRLDDQALARKLAAAHNYPELQGEVASALERNGAEAFRVECLRPLASSGRRAAGRPFYEEYGKRQVEAGRYAEAIRYDRHVWPIRDSLWRRAGLDGPS